MLSGERTKNVRLLMILSIASTVFTLALLITIIFQGYAGPESSTSLNQYLTAKYGKEV
jgi:ABC-type microcin C transport system permease subunit YejE